MHTLYTTQTTASSQPPSKRVSQIPVEPGLTLDGETAWDWLVMSIGALMLCINLAFLVYALHRRKYPPIRAKNLRLISAMYISMVLWYIGAVASNLSLGSINSFKGSCIIFLMWFRTFFGIILYMTLSSLRLYMYIRIFRKMRAFTARNYLVPLCIYLVVILAVGVPATVYQDRLSVRYVHHLHICVSGDEFQNTVFAVIWAAWIIKVVMTYLARNINASFNEYNEMLVSSVVENMFILYITVAHHIHRHYSLYVWDRAVTMFLEILMAQTGFFMLTFVPVYQCVFHEKEYEALFFRKMHDDGMISKYARVISTTVSSTSSFIGDDGSGSSDPGP